PRDFTKSKKPCTGLPTPQGREARASPGKICPVKVSVRLIQLGRVRKKSPHLSGANETAGHMAGVSIVKGRPKATVDTVGCASCASRQGHAGQSRPAKTEIPRQSAY